MNRRNFILKTLGLGAIIPAISGAATAKDGYSFIGAILCEDKNGFVWTFYPRTKASSEEEGKIVIKVLEKRMFRSYCIFSVYENSTNIKFKMVKNRFGDIGLENTCNKEFFNRLTPTARGALLWGMMNRSNAIYEIMCDGPPILKGY
jgi:hypothetical protein